MPDQEGRHRKPLEELDLKLAKFIGPHLRSDVVSIRLSDRERLTIEELTLTLLKTTG